MENIDKPAEETLTDSLKGMSVKIPPVLLPHIINAMKAYAAQQLSEYKERLKNELCEFPEILFECPDVFELIDKL